MLSELFVELLKALIDILAYVMLYLAALLAITATVLFLIYAIRFLVGVDAARIIVLFCLSAAVIRGIPTKRVKEGDK